LFTSNSEKYNERVGMTKEDKFIVGQYLIRCSGSFLLFLGIQKSHVTLSSEQVAHLSELTTCGTIAVKTYRRATALLALHEGQSYSAVAATLGVGYATVSNWAEQFRTTGLGLLPDKPRRGRPLVITGPERANVTALACSEAPSGYSQWSLRLLAGQSVELGLCGQRSASSVHAILKKTRSSPS